MQMIEVRMRHQYGVDRRQVAHPQPRPTQPLQNKNPLREVWVDDNVLPADLQKEARVSDECDA